MPQSNTDLFSHSSRHPKSKWVCRAGSFWNLQGTIPSLAFSSLWRALAALPLSPGSSSESSLLSVLTRSLSDSDPCLPLVRALEMPRSPLECKLRPRQAPHLITRARSPQHVGDVGTGYGIRVWASLGTSPSRLPAHPVLFMIPAQLWSSGKSLFPLTAHEKCLGS